MKYLALSLLLLSACRPAPPSDEEALVREYTAAFNAHDAVAMAGFMTEDVAWISVAGDSMAVEVKGRDAMVAAMEDYFEQVPDVRSTIESTLVLSPFLSVTERTNWNDGTGEQRSIAMYEVQQGAIARVWYHAVVR